MRCLNFARKLLKIAWLLINRMILFAYITGPHREVCPACVPVRVWTIFFWKKNNLRPTIFGMLLHLDTITGHVRRSNSSSKFTITQVMFLFVYECWRPVEKLKWSWESICVYELTLVPTHKYTVVGKRCHYILPLTLGNTNRFSKFFHWQT